MHYPLHTHTHTLQRKKFYWRLDTKCLTLYKSDTSSQYHREIALADILAVDPMVNPEVYPLNPPHVFEIVTTAMTYYVGADMTGALPKDLKPPDSVSCRSLLVNVVVVSYSPSSPTSLTFSLLSPSSPLFLYPLPSPSFLLFLPSLLPLFAPYCSYPFLSPSSLLPLSFLSPSSSPSSLLLSYSLSFLSLSLFFFSSSFHSLLLLSFPLSLLSPSSSPSSLLLSYSLSFLSLSLFFFSSSPHTLSFHSQCSEHPWRCQ